MELRGVLKKSWQDDVWTLGRPWSWAFWALRTCWACSENAALLVHRGWAVLLAHPPTNPGHWVVSGEQCPSCRDNATGIQQVEDINIYNAQYSLHHKLPWSKVPTGLRWRHSAPRREFRWARTIAAHYTLSGHTSICINPEWVCTYWFIQTWSTERPPLFFPNCLF